MFTHSIDEKPHIVKNLEAELMISIFVFWYIKPILIKR